VSETGKDEWEAEVDPGRSLTEDFVALRFVAEYKGKLAYCHSQGAWFEFDGSVWRRQEMQRAFHYARETCREFSLVAKTPGPLQKVAFASGVEKFSQRDPAFARFVDHWDQDPFLLGTPNGTVDLRTGRFRISMPGDHITKATAIAPVEGDCPMWKRFLLDSTAGDHDFIRFLQQICGYALTGDTREHALFFIYGPGGNGKSVFLNVLTDILGDYSTTAPMESFTATKYSGIPADLAMMRGARVVTSSETESGRGWAEARIKQITGGDKISARFMRENFFQFTPTFKLVIVGNHKPDLTQVDEAMRRRFHIIPFTIKPTNPDRELPKKLKAEYPAILQWMIEGCLDWQENGIKPPQIVLDATQEYFEDQDVFNQWLSESCEVDTSNSYLSELASGLYRSWSAFAKAGNFDPGSMKGFSQMLAKAGFSRKRTKRGQFFHCIRLNATNDDERYGV
jgi:putative DNA primase/helicase